MDKLPEETGDKLCQVKELDIYLRGRLTTVLWRRSLMNPVHRLEQIPATLNPEMKLRLPL